MWQYRHIRRSAARKDSNLSVELQHLIGANVACLRQAVGWRQEDLAAAMAKLGYPWKTRQTVYDTEQGKRQLRLDELVAIAGLFEVSPGSLLFRDLSGEFDELVIELPSGGSRVPLEAWEAWWRWVEDEPVTPGVKVALTAVGKWRGKKSLAWSRWWLGRNRGQRFLATRKLVLAEREMEGTLPGPTYVSEVDVVVPVRIPPCWNTTIELAAGEPYTARDDFERKALRPLGEAGKLRKLPSWEARDIRERRST